MKLFSRDIAVFTKYRKKEPKVGIDVWAIFKFLSVVLDVARKRGLRVRSDALGSRPIKFA